MRYLLSLISLLLLTAPVARAAPPSLAVAENGLPQVELASFTADPTGAAPYTVTVWPAQPFQGALLVVEVSAPGIRTAGGSFGGKPLRFHRLDPGTLRGVAPVPHDARPGPAELALRVTVGEGKARRTIERSVPLSIAAVDYPRDRLSVDPKFTKLSAAARRQIAADRQHLSSVWKASPDKPLFSASFQKPREDRTTAPYGTRRTFNGAVKSVHGGWDIDGEIGDEVLCTNDGIVRHAGDLYYSGETLILDHGSGIFSVYMHLSGYLVKEGERVTRGQPCALVGDTGRVTGPHLHFGTRVGGSYVHPEALLRFEFERPLAAAKRSADEVVPATQERPLPAPDEVPAFLEERTGAARLDPCAELKAQLAKRKDWLARTAAERNTIAHVTDPADFAALLQHKTMARCAEHPDDPDCAPPPLEADVSELTVELDSVTRDPGELVADGREPDALPHDPVVRELEKRLRSCEQP